MLCHYLRVILLVKSYIRLFVEYFDCQDVDDFVDVYEVYWRSRSPEGQNAAAPWLAVLLTDKF